MDGIKKYIPGFLLGFNPLYVAISLSLLMLAGIIALKGAVLYNADTPTYIEAWNNRLLHGELDPFRTPLYPVLIGLGGVILGSTYCFLLPVIVQIVVFYLCGIVFSRMIFALIADRRIAWFTVFVYFLFYPIINMLNVLGTEALAFSLTSLWTYCVWKFMQRATFGNGVAITVITLLEVMLRPSMLILAIAIAGLVVAGVFIRRYRRRVLWLLLTLIPVGACIKVYTDEIERIAGLPTISVVSVVNTYYMAREFNDIYPELLTDTPGAVAVMQHFQKEGHRLSEEYILRQYKEFDTLLDNGIMTYSDMQTYADRVKKEHPAVWYRHIVHRIIDSLKMQGPVKNACNYLVVTLYTLCFAWAWIRYRRFSLVNFLILMIGGGSLLSMFLYAQNDFGRLMLPTSPLLILMGGQLLTCLRLHPFAVSLRNFNGSTKPTATECN